MSDAVQVLADARTIGDIIAFWARRTPDAPALVSPQQGSLTYSELEAAIAQFVLELRQHGITPGDRLALLIPSSLTATVAVLGAMTVAIAMPLNPADSVAELGRAAAGASAVLTGVAEAGKAQSVAARVGARAIGLIAADGNRFLRMRGWRSLQIMAHPAAMSRQAIAVIYATSGTTGVPSRVPLTQRQMLTASTAYARALRLDADDRCLNVGHIHYVAHVANLLSVLQTGGATVIVPNGEPAAMLASLQRLPISWIVAVPQVYRALLQATEKAASAVRAPWLRFLVSAGTHLPDDLAASMEATFGAPVLNLYGLTEARSLALSPLSSGRRKPGSVGPVLCDELRIVDESGRSLPAGTTGEIVARGPHVFSGYLDDATANTAAFLPGGWFRTGDLGHVDDEGTLFITGRLKELINRGGEKMLPVDVEDILQSHPAVCEAAVFGVPDAILGEDVVAAIVVRPGLRVTARELRAWMLDQLAPPKAPRRIWFVSDLPRTATGKVQRGRLADRYRERADA